MEEKKTRFLTADEVELRISNNGENWAQLLIYKTARTDMALLDELYGAGDWQTDYKEIKGNMYCGIGVLVNNQWIWRWNCGVESKGTGEDDPNNQKGEASDAFKRAGFLWNIGRELYKWKGIFINLTEKDFKEKNGKKYVKTQFSVATINYTEEGEPQHLVIIDANGDKRYEYGFSKKENTDDKKNQSSTITDEKEVAENIPYNESDSNFKIISERMKGKKVTFVEIVNWCKEHISYTSKLNEIERENDFPELLRFIDGKENA